MRNLWKSAVVVVAISASLSTGLAGGATVKAHDAGVGPTVILAVVDSVQSWTTGYGESHQVSTETTINVQWLPVEGTIENPVVGYRIGSLLSDKYREYQQYCGWFFFCGFDLPPSATSASFVVPEVHSIQGNFGGWGGSEFLTVKFADGTSRITTFSTPSGAYLLAPSSVSYGVPGDGTALISWTNPSQSTMMFGTTDVSITGHQVTVGDQVCEAGVTGICTFTQLDPNSQLSARVCTETNVGTLLYCTSSSVFWPKFAPRLTADVPTVFTRGRSTVMVVGGTPNGVLTTIVDGKVQGAFPLNQAGQAKVSFQLLSYGTHSLAMKVGKEKATSIVHVPSVSCPSVNRHGTAFQIPVKFAPAKASIVITTSDGRTLYGKANGSGGASIAVKTTIRTNLEVNILINGTSIGSYKVRVI